MKLSQTRLLVADVGGSVRFYRDVLGLRLNWGDETSRYASFETGDGRAQLAVFDRTAMAEAVTAVDPPYTPDRAVIVFGVDNMDTVLDEIRERWPDRPRARGPAGLGNSRGVSTGSRRQPDRARLRHAARGLGTGSAGGGGRARCLR